MMDGGQSVWGFYKSFNEQDYLSEYVKQPKPMPLGISALDRALAPDDGLGGIPSGIPTILGGEPGCGKSAIGTTALYNAPFNGMLPMFFTIEMTRQMVLSRLLSIHTDAKRRNELSNGAKFNERTAQVFWSSTGNVIQMSPSALKRMANTFRKVFITSLVPVEYGVQVRVVVHLHLLVHFHVLASGSDVIQQLIDGRS
jgi:hypothetical protein